MRYRLTLRDPSVPMSEARKIIRAALERDAEHPVQVSQGAWDKDDFVTYVLDSPTELSRLGLELLLKRLERRIGKVQSVDPVSKRWRLKMRAPNGKKAMEVAQIYTRAHKTLTHETLTVNGRSLELVLEFDDSVDRDAAVGLALDIPGISKARLMEVKPVG